MKMLLPVKSLPIRAVSSRTTTTTTDHEPDQSQVTTTRPEQVQPNSLHLYCTRPEHIPGQISCMLRSGAPPTDSLCCDAKYWRAEASAFTAQLRMSMRQPKLSIAAQTPPAPTCNLLDKRGHRAAVLLPQPQREARPSCTSTRLATVHSIAAAPSCRSPW